MKNNSWVPKVLLVAYIILFIWMGIAPFDRDVWIAENAPIFGIAVVLVIMYFRGIQFSNLSYILMSVLLFVHTIGGHYTFERVPFDWFNDLFGFERNMYDRVGHFAVGFYAYPFAELLTKRRLVNARWVTYLMPLFFIVTVAAFYELFEWWYAVTYGGSAGTAFLGSQGDIWDAQKDILMDTLGGLVALVLYWVNSRVSRNEKISI
jgi:putative membrane protein